MAKFYGIFFVIWVNFGKYREALKHTRRTGWRHARLLCCWKSEVWSVRRLQIKNGGSTSPQNWILAIWKMGTTKILVNFSEIETVLQFSPFARAPDIFQSDLKVGPHRLLDRWNRILVTNHFWAVSQGYFGSPRIWVNLSKSPSSYRDAFLDSWRLLMLRQAASSHREAARAVQTPRRR